MNLTKSKVFFFFCLSFISGVVLASFILIPYFLSGIFLIAGIILIALFWPARIATPARHAYASHAGWQSVAGGTRNWKAVVLGFCLLFMVFGAWRFQSETKIKVYDISQFNEKEKIALIGIVSQQPEKKMENQRIIIEVVKIVGMDKNVSGKILITANKYPGFQYGDELEIKGKLKEPKTDDEFDYKQYLAKDDIYSIMYYPEMNALNKNKGNPVVAALFKIKDKFESNLAEIFPEPQAGLADGLILGEKSALPQKLLDIFAVVGITHIIALSGFNITIIAESLRRLFNRFLMPKNYSFWITVLFIISFVLMTGAAASIVRAGVMGILIVLARRVGRLYNIRNALALAAVIMIYSNPKILRFDLGFQLSFLATLGLVYMSPIIEKYFQWLPEKFEIRGIGIATISAQLAVFPLLLFIFGKLSLIAPLVNLLILPFIPLTMFLIFLSAIIGFIWIKLGIVFGWLAWLFLTYLIKLSELLARIPGAAMNIKIGWVMLMVLYSILLIFIYILFRTLSGRKKES